MRKAVLTFVIAFALATGCRAGESFAKVPGVKFDDYLVSKASAEEGMPMYDADRGGHWLDKGKCWVPSAAEATEAEAAVRHFIHKAQHNLPLAFPEVVDHAKQNAARIEWCRRSIVEVQKNYAQCGIQFVGISVHGRKEIFCIYFWQLSPDLGAGRKVVYVEDGGSWFWQIEYTPATKSCAGLQINGGA